MNILAAIKREERKLEKQVAAIQHKLKRISAAAEAFGRSANKNVTKDLKKGVRRAKGVMSAATKSKIRRAAKKRWAKIKADAKKLAR